MCGEIDYFVNYSYNIFIVCLESLELVMPSADVLYTFLPIADMCVCVFRRYVAHLVCGCQQIHKSVVSVVHPPITTFIARLHRHYYCYLFDVVVVELYGIYSIFRVIMLFNHGLEFLFSCGAVCYWHVRADVCVCMCVWSKR